MFGLLELLSGLRWLFLLHFTGNSAYPKPLSAEEETKCFEQLQSEDSAKRKAAKDRLVLHNLRLVAHVIKKYDTHAESKEDLLSIGTIGLLKAVDTFSTERRVRFSTYAARCVENEILMKFRSNKKTERDVSLQELTESDPESSRTLFADPVLDPSDPQEEVEDRLMKEALLREMTRLPKREGQVLRMRYGLSPYEREYAQWEVAKKLGISRSYVSRIEKSAISRLKKHLNGE